MSGSLIFNRLGLIVLILAWAVPLSAQPSTSGVVLDSSSQPISGAQVELVPVPGNYEAGRLRLEGRAPEPVAKGRSDAAGRFHLQASGLGVFKVVVRGEGKVPMQSVPLPLVEAVELPPVVLSPDTRARLRVVDASGRPLAGAWLYAAGFGEHESGRVGDGWLVDFRVGRTGVDGELTLPRLAGEKLDVSIFPPGGAEEKRLDLEGGTITLSVAEGEPHRLRVLTPEGRPVEGALVRIGDLSWPVGLTDREGRLQIPRRSGEPAQLRIVAREGNRQSVEVSAGHPPSEEVAVVLSAPAVVSGRVTAGARPLSGALVRTGSDPGAFVLTDPGGLYHLLAPEMRFQLLAVAPRHLPSSAGVTRAHVRSGRGPALALTLAATVRGQVLNDQGAPLAGVELVAAPEIRPGFPEVVMDRASTDAEGRFELRRMQAGRGYELQALRPGYLPAVAQAVAPEPLREAPPLKIVLMSARPAQGRVQDAAGRPIAGAEISLMASREPGGPRTDARGRFTVAQIPANPLDLAVRKQGYAPAIVRGVRVPPGTGAADLGVVILRPGARLAGRVADRSGRPIAGAEVFRVEDLKNMDQMSARLESDQADAHTSPDGRFALEDLPARLPVNLLVRARGYLPAGVRGALAPNSEPVAVRLEDAALLRGRVMDEERRPVPGARLELVVHKERPVIRLATADRDGHFEIPDAPRGSGTLGVKAQGFVPIEDLEVTLPRAEPGGEWILTLEKGALLSGRIALTDGAAVSGARVSAAGSSVLSDDDGFYTVEGVAPGPVVVGVFHPSYRRFSKEMVIEPGANQLDVTFEPGVEVTGRVADERDAPVAGAWVLLSSQVRGELEYRARAAADGTFRLYPVARGSYRLRAGHEDFPPAALEKLVVVGDEPVGEIRIALSRGGSIAGHVLGLKPEELAQVNIEAETAGKTYPAMLDSEGRYEVRRLEPGDYLVRASLVAGQRQVQARVSLESGQREVTRDLEFTRRLTLSGQVLYGGEPLPEAEVEVHGTRFAVERSVVTDYQGGFRLEDLEPDVYALGLSHPGEHLIHNENVELTGDREIVIRLQMATVAGLVQDGKSGSSISGALVLLRHVAGAEGPEFLISGGSGPEGDFLLSQVPPGSYRLTVSANGYAPKEQEIAVPAGQDLGGLEIALESTHGLDLTVHLASGKVPELVHVRVLAPSGAPVVTESRPPDASGGLHLPTVPEGSWQLLLSAPGGAVQESLVAVPGEPRSLTLPQAGRLRVRVPALLSSDLIAAVTLHGGDQQPFWTLGLGGAIQESWPLVGGNAMVDGLPAGLWQIRVETPDGHAWTGDVTTSGKAEASLVLE